VLRALLRPATAIRSAPLSERAGGAFVPRRIATAAIAARTHALLHALDGGFVLALDAIEIRDCALVDERRIPDVRQERHAGAIDCERPHDVHRNAPGVDVQHEVRKKPKVIGCDALSEVGMFGGKLESTSSPDAPPTWKLPHGKSSVGYDRASSAAPALCGVEMPQEEPGAAN
jgi:hypothetical protein